MSSVLSAKAFQDEIAAYGWVEEQVWPDGPTCPHCGVLKDGEVVESGTHNELCEQQGVYANLWAAQERSLGQDMELERNLEAERETEEHETKS